MELTHPLEIDTDNREKVGGVETARRWANIGDLQT